MRRRISLSSAVASAIFRFRFVAQRASEDDDAAEHQWNAQQHAHRQPAPEEAELDVGLAKQFADDARHAVAERKTSGDDAGALEGAEAHQKAEHDEEDDALQRCFIELAGMARDRTAVGKDHRPRHVTRPSPQFAVDEIGTAAEEQSDRTDRGGNVAERQHRDAALEREYDDGDDAAGDAAVKRHAAVPQFEDLQRMLDEMRKIVEQHIAGAAAEDDAERDPDDEVVEVDHRQRRRAAP